MKNTHYFILLGLFAGFVSASLGIGGGAVMVPILTVFFAFKIKDAVPLSLATILPVSIIGTIVHLLFEPQNINILFVLLTATGSIAGSRLGAKLSKHISTKLLSILFALLLIFSSLKMTGLFEQSHHIAFELSNYTLLFLGILVGISAALFGIGGGLIMVPAFVLLYGFPMHSAIATSLAIIIPTSLFSVIFHKKISGIQHQDALRPLVISGLMGAILGASITEYMPGATLKSIFGYFLIIITIKFILNIFKHNQAE